MTTDAPIISPGHPDAVTYQRAADAFRAGGLDELATTIDEDVVWHLPGTSWMATFKLRDVYVSGSDDHVLAAQRFGATVDGEERFFDVGSVMRFRDGRQIERWFHIHDQTAFDEFFARF
jgi:ketosteroid isomerase-like protein